MFTATQNEIWNLGRQGLETQTRVGRLLFDSSTKSVIETMGRAVELGSSLLAEMTESWRAALDGAASTASSVASEMHSKASGSAKSK